MMRRVIRRRTGRNTGRRRKLVWVRQSVFHSQPVNEGLFALDLLSPFTIGSNGLQTFPGTTVMRTLIKVRMASNVAGEGFSRPTSSW